MTFQAAAAKTVEGASPVTCDNSIEIWDFTLLFAQFQGRNRKWTMFLAVTKTCVSSFQDYPQ